MKNPFRPSSWQREVGCNITPNRQYPLQKPAPNKARTRFRRRIAHVLQGSLVLGGLSYSGYILSGIPSYGIPSAPLLNQNGVIDAYVRALHPHHTRVDRTFSLGKASISAILYTRSPQHEALLEDGFKLLTDRLAHMPLPLQQDRVLIFESEKEQLAGNKGVTTFKNSSHIKPIILSQSATPTVVAHELFHALYQDSSTVSWSSVVKEGLPHYLFNAPSQKLPHVSRELLLRYKGFFSSAQNYYDHDWNYLDGKMNEALWSTLEDHDTSLIPQVLADIHNNHTHPSLSHIHAPSTPSCSPQLQQALTLLESSDTPPVIVFPEYTDKKKQLYIFSTSSELLRVHYELTHADGSKDRPQDFSNVPPNKLLNVDTDTPFEDGDVWHVSLLTEKGTSIAYSFLFQDGMFYPVG